MNSGTSAARLAVAACKQQGRGGGAIASTSLRNSRGHLHSFAATAHKTTNSNGISCSHGQIYARSGTGSGRRSTLVSNNNNKRYNSQSSNNTKQNNAVTTSESTAKKVEPAAKPEPANADLSAGSTGAVAINTGSIANAGTKTTTKLQIAARMAAGLILLPAFPIGYWWYQTMEDRKKHAHSVQTKVRIPTVQTLDEIMIDKIQPGDVLIFDRKCDKCAAGPLAAAACILSKAALCGQSNHAFSDNSSTQLDHVGVVVPGFASVSKNSKQQTQRSFDEGSELLLLEATPQGVVARPLLERLEMSRARTVLLLPLSAPLEQNRRKNFDTVPSNDLLYDDDNDGKSKRNNNDEAEDELNEKTLRAKLYVRKQLINFRDTALRSSDKMSYETYHSLIGVTGALAYGVGLGLHQKSPSPVSPSAWLVVSALQQAGVAMKVEQRAALDVKPEDFLRDFRFYETDVVRLRPGWKFLSPVILRETSKSL
jgi:lysozyme family protein